MLVFLLCGVLLAGPAAATNRGHRKVGTNECRAVLEHTMGFAAKLRSDIVSELQRDGSPATTLALIRGEIARNIRVLSSTEARTRNTLPMVAKAAHSDLAYLRGAKAAIESITITSDGHHLVNGHRCTRHS